MYGFAQIKANKQSESIKTISKSGIVSKVNKEVKSYTISDHIKPDWRTSRALYDEFFESIIKLDERIEESITSVYVWYKIWNKVVIDIKPRKEKIVLELLRVQPKDIKDSERRLKNIPYAMKNWNKYVSTMDLKSSDDIQYWMMIIKQIIKKFF